MLNKFTLPIFLIDHPFYFNTSAPSLPPKPIFKLPNLFMRKLQPPTFPKYSLHKKLDKFISIDII